ncbi:MAG: DUF4364 family protein [Candidatus Bathyarchaeota archaeon]
MVTIRENELQVMPRSTFEVQIGILNALAQYGPLKLTHIIYNANLNCNSLKQLLDHLIKNGLVEEQKLGKKRKLYSITEKGQRVLEYTRKIDNYLPLMESIKI